MDNSEQKGLKMLHGLIDELTVYIGLLKTISAGSANG